jgi:hypothetical protein
MGGCEERIWERKAEESPLLEAIARERLMKRQQAGKRFSGCCGDLWIVEISGGAVIASTSESCIKVCNKSGHQSKTPFIVTHILRDNINCWRLWLLCSSYKSVRRIELQNIYCIVYDDLALPEWFESSVVCLFFKSNSEQQDNVVLVLVQWHFQIVCP